MSPLFITGAVLAADQAAAVLKRLDPAQRTGVVLSLVAIIVVGIGLVVLVALGAHYVRRIVRQRPPKRPRETSDWDRKRPADGEAAADD